MRKRLVLLSLLFALLSSVYGQIPSDFIAWKFKSGGYYCGTLVNHDTLYCGSMDGNFYALNSKTGKLLWQYKTGQPITTTAALHDTVICIESTNKLFGINTKTGKFLWSYLASNSTPAETYPTNYQHSSPVIYNNIAYFGDEWGNMNGINIYTGKLVFKYTIKKTYTRASDKNIRTKPAIKDDIIYFGDYGASVYAISLKDSSEKWIHKMESPKWDGSVVSEIIIRDTVLYAGGYNNLFTPLNIKTGNPIWTYKDENTFLPSTPIFYNDNVIMGATIGSSIIHCLNIKDGTQKWFYQAKGIFFVKPIIIQDTILVINSTDPWVNDKSGLVYFINCRNGSLINEIHLPDPTESSPQIIGDLLYLGTSDGMYAITYKPYLIKNETSKLLFDSSTENIVLKQGDALAKRYSITNTSNFCDNITITATANGNDSIPNILILNLKDKHIKPTEKLECGFDIKPNKLESGKYTIKFKVSSANKPNISLFEKQVNITVDKTNTGLNNVENNDALMVYPNPFTGNVNFVVASMNESNILLSICSTDGRCVFSKQYKLKGEKKICWNGLDNYGNELKNNMYIYSIKTDKQTKTGVLIKR